MALIYFRAAAGAIITLIIAIWFYDASPERQHLLPLTGILFLFMLVLQLLLSYSNVSLRNQYLIGYGGDALIAGLLVFVTGGVNSPLSFLSGLIIIASGLHAMRLLPQLVAILACSTYLAAAYADVWVAYQELLDFQQALNALLQVSALLLVGGVMAYIARRHMALRATSDHAVQQHRELKDLYDRVMQSMHEGMIVLDDQLQLSDMNDAARTLLGSLTLKELLQSAELSAYLKQPVHSTFQCDYSVDEQVMLVRVTRLDAGQDATWLITLVDISEVRQLEKELLQQEKMAALGQMAAMLAHEIRNPIQTMTQGLEFIGSDVQQDNNIKHIMHDEMLRLNRLATTMLEYAKPLRPNPAAVDIDALIDKVVQQAEISAAGRVKCLGEAGTLYLDPDHFRLVLDNLLSNALAHCQESDQVCIEMSSSGSRWQLKVSNPGVVPESLKSSLFEPFVSGRSRGVGLGLATVQQVCRVNGWLIDLITDEHTTSFVVTAITDSPDRKITREVTDG